MGARLFVDGYNLARSGAVPLAEDPTSPEGRAELCALLSSFAREKGFTLTVVFDGRGSGSPVRSRSAFKGGAALYSSRAETADDVIRDLARDAPAGTIVVTSDRGLASTLSARGVSVVSCEELASRLFAHRLAGIKGGEEEDRPPASHRAKKGEGHKLKKQERKKSKLLGRL